MTLKTDDRRRGLPLRRPTPTIESIVAAVRSRRTSPKAVVREAIERIAREDQTITAWVCLRPNAERRSADSASRGSLAGVPFGVKDLIDVAGLPTSLGLTEFEYRPVAAQRSALVVQRLESEGAVVVGKTVTSALGLDRPGPTRNPIDPARSPGASSSGSAAAVAAGMVPLALGSQAIGSVIRPASYCGVWAFVPSHGAVSSDGSLVLSESLDRIGVFASSALGLMLAGRILIGAADSETTGSAGKDAQIAIIEASDLICRAPEAMLRFAELAGRHSRLASLRLPIDLDAVLAMTRTVAAFEFRRSVASRQSRLASLSGALIDSLASPRPEEKVYREALAFRDRLRAAWDRLTAGFDALLLPSAVAEAPLGLLDNQDPAPASLGSLLGVPAVNIPLFVLENGMPLGCQMLGRKGADLDLIRLAVQFAGEVHVGLKPA